MWRINGTKSGPPISSAPHVPLKVSEAIRGCPRPINDALLKSQCSKYNIKRICLCESVKGGLSPVFRTILVKDTHGNIEYIKKYPFCLTLSSRFCSLILFSILLYSSDLDNFKTQTARSAVNVREGQGVVLLCGPPAHSGGRFAKCHFCACACCFPFRHDSEE